MLDRFKIISVPWLLRWMPLLVLLIAAFLRFDALTQQSFWNDEGNTLRLIQRDTSALIDAASRDIHPPGYYLTLKAWTRLTGETELGLRSLSAVWGVIAVAGTYALGARLYARAAGILAALLVAVNAFQIYYSQEARMYAQLVALAVLSLWLLVWLIQTSPQSRRFVWIALALALVNAWGLYTHYTYPFTMLIQGVFFVWWLVRADDPKRALLIYVLANLLTLLLFLPWFPTALDQITTWPADDVGTPLGDKIWMVIETITYGDSGFSVSIIDWLLLGLLALTVMLPDWYPQRPSNGWRVGLVLGWLLLVAGSLIFSGAFREANLKFLLPAQIAVALLIGRGAYLLWDVGSMSAATPLEMVPRYLALFAYSAVLMTSLSGAQTIKMDASYFRDDYRAMAAVIAQNESDSTAVILNAPGQSEVFTYYYNGAATLFPLPQGLGGDDTLTAQETQAVIEQFNKIYVLFWGEGERDPNGIVKRTLDNNAFEINSTWYGDVRLVQYGVLQTPPQTPSTATDLRFGDHIVLAGYAIQGSFADGLLGVTLFWQTDAPLEARYKVFVQVLYPDGRLAAQHDSEPANNTALTNQWQVGQTVVDNHGIALPRHLPTGEYTVIVGVYELDNPDQRLRVESTNSDVAILETINHE